ncbi:sulfatase-like hydrolase/transferase [Aquicoccus sp. SCR17]|nr:sulfatase-like hydrolase/transferase [Carideicomes alvinocaridis]
MTRPIKNILFIMFDQLRWDYLSCYGHPRLETPNIDRLAGMGVRFDRAYVQSPLCGPSRMSTYTGRYVHSHGASWNGVPLKVGERTMGDHLREAGVDAWLVGKTHMKADAEGMARLGLEPDSMIGVRVAECGFDVFERDDGLRPEGPDGLYDPKGARRYNDWLREKGYGGENPWHDHANSAVDAEGNVLSGWFMKNVSHPANIAEEDSETPYLTRRAMEFMQQAEAPWLCHLSYIKPHWPYVAPAPYNDMYGHNDLLPPVRTEAEFENAHPVLRAMMNSPVGRAFSRDEVRETVLPVYMGLIKQCDDQMGVLFDWMEREGRMEDTMIVVTSDHGDYMGDHWMGEKTFFHDAAIRVPLIVYDPRPEADATRGTACDALVEQIDLVPTFIEAAGGEPPYHVVEGRSLLPFLRGETPADWRSHVIAEYDFSAAPIADALDLGPREAICFMVHDGRWKLVHCEGGLPPLLFDLENDPGEVRDLGTSPVHAEVIDRLYDRLFEWARRPSQRTTRSEAQLREMRQGPRRRGVVLGVYDENDVPLDLTVRYRDRRARVVAESQE